MERQRLMAIALAVSMFLAGLLAVTLVDELLGEEEEEGPGGVDLNDPYEVDIDPEDFVSEVDNPYHPLPVGALWVYEGQTEDGLERVEFRVLNETRTVMGVTCTVVRDTVTVDGEMVEDTYDWFAQDVSGNVWYFGEDSKDYEDGELVGTGGSWEAGIDGAYPGIIMLADPHVGLTYRQEYLKGEAEDMATVLSLDETVTVRGTTYTGVLKTKDFTPIDPGTSERKYYAHGLGVVLEEDGDERVELVEFTMP